MPRLAIALMRRRAAGMAAGDTIHVRKVPAGTSGDATHGRHGDPRRVTTQDDVGRGLLVERQQPEGMGEATRLRCDVCLRAS
jgi:hypothetical protein